MIGSIGNNDNEAALVFRFYKFEILEDFKGDGKMVAVVIGYIRVGPSGKRAIRRAFSQMHSGDRSLTIGIAKVSCSFCHGNGTCFRRNGSEAPCDCLLRAFFAPAGGGFGNARCRAGT
jgi:hypothetical protein